MMRSRNFQYPYTYHPPKEHEEPQQCERHVRDRSARTLSIVVDEWLCKCDTYHRLVPEIRPQRVDHICSYKSSDKTGAGPHRDECLHRDAWIVIQ